MADVSKVKLNGTAYNVKDASVPSWARQSSKPSYTQDEVGDGSTYKRVTSTEKSTWNNKGTYSKPSGGIPKSDLASAVQTSLGKADTALQSFTESDPTVPSWAKQSSKPSYTASEVGAIATSAKGAANGVASLDSAGKVPSSQLPSYVDDVLEYSAKSSFPSTGETGKIYVDTSTNKTYRWSGSAYVEISASLALGETSSTAYYGDKGKTAYNHSQTTSGNPHNVTKSDVGLGNVGNFKAVSTVASQGLSDTEKSNARANIGAGTGNGTYSKPSGGIPKSDLASAVQTSLGKADTALQSFTETDPTVPSWAKQSSKPSYTYSEVGAAPASHGHYQITTVGDYRSIATKPDDYPNIMQFKGLKNNSAIGNPSSDTYSYVLGLRGWPDHGGGNAHEFAFNDTGIFTRRGASTSWGSWAKLAMTSDIPSSLPASDVYSWAKQSSKPSYTQDEVSDGSTYKRVTSTEKNTWNSKGTYSKPSGGIPKSDLASAVQTSLGKADTALQSFTESDPTVPSWAKQSSKPSYTQDEVGDGSTYKRVTSTEKNTWNSKGTYSKPSGGIPKSDLASAVQTSLGKADSALQSHQTIKQDGVTGATVNRFGTCSIAAGTAAKTVSITTGTFTLEAGARVTVKFSNANTASSPTLNVNSTGAKNIFHKGAQITTGTNKGLLAGTVDFIYDGTQYHLIGNYIDSDTHRAIKVDGTQVLASNSTALNFIGTGHVRVAHDSSNPGNITFYEENWLTFVDMELSLGDLTWTASSSSPGMYYSGNVSVYSSGTKPAFSYILGATIMDFNALPNALISVGLSGTSSIWLLSNTNAFQSYTKLTLRIFGLISFGEA